MMQPLHIANVLCCAVFAYWVKGYTCMADTAISFERTLFHSSIHSISQYYGRGKSKDKITWTFEETSDLINEMAQAHMQKNSLPLGEYPSYVSLSG